MAEAVAAVSDAKATIGNGILPLQLMLQVMRDTRNPIELRLEAARAASPFIHPRMPQAVAVAPEAKIEGVRVEIVGVPPDLLQREFSPARTSENGEAGTPQKCLAARAGE